MTSLKKKLSGKSSSKEVRQDKPKRRDPEDRDHFENLEHVQEESAQAVPQEQDVGGQQHQISDIHLLMKRGVPCHNFERKPKRQARTYRSVSVYDKQLMTKTHAV